MVRTNRSVAVSDVQTGHFLQCMHNGLAGAGRPEGLLTFLPAHSMSVDRMRKGAILAHSPSGAWLIRSSQCTCASIWQWLSLSGRSTGTAMYFAAGSSTWHTFGERRRMRAHPFVDSLILKECAQAHMRAHTYVTTHARDKIERAAVTHPVAAHDVGVHHEAQRKEDVRLKGLEGLRHPLVLKIQQQPRVQDRCACRSAPARQHSSVNATADSDTQSNG